MTCFPEDSRSNNTWAKKLVRVIKVSLLHQSRHGEEGVHKKLNAFSFCGCTIAVVEEKPRVEHAFCCSVFAFGIFLAVHSRSRAQKPRMHASITIRSRSMTSRTTPTCDVTQTICRRGKGLSRESLIPRHRQRTLGGRINGLAIRVKGLEAKDRKNAIDTWKMFLRKTIQF